MTIDDNLREMRNLKYPIIFIGMIIGHKNGKMVNGVKLIFICLKIY